AWYLNDGTIVGDTLMVAKSLDIIKNDGPAHGLFLNIDKSELFWHVEDPRSRTEYLSSAKWCSTSSGRHYPVCFSRIPFANEHPSNQDIYEDCIESQGSYFKHALDVFNTTCNLDVLSVTTCTYAPHMMKSLEKCYFGVIEKDLDSKYTLSPRHVSILNCICASHAQDFIFTIPNDGLGQRTNHRQFHYVLCYRLVVPMFSEDSLCSSCKTHQMDQWGDDAVHYSSEVDVKFKHNLVRDILVDICSKVGIRVRKEASMGFFSEDAKDLRPADLSLFNWLQGKDACLDVTCISPFAGTGETSCAPGVALHNAVEKKKRKYGFVCEENKYKFIPFAFSTFGEFDTDALDTLSRIKSVFISHSNNAKNGVFIFHKTKLLRDAGTGGSGSSFEDALCVFNMNIETDLLSNPKSTFSSSPRHMALWECQLGDHNSDWLRAPCSTCHWVFTGDIYRDQAVSRTGVGYVCVDLTGSSPLTQTGMTDFVAGAQLCGD
nr:beta-myrcene synthase [Tanacetum cinerariifolium]